MQVLFNQAMKSDRPYWSWYSNYLLNIPSVFSQLLVQKIILKWLASDWCQLVHIFNTEVLDK